MSQLARKIVSFISKEPRLLLHKESKIIEDGTPTGTIFMVVPESPIICDAAKLNRLFREITFPDAHAESHTCTLDHSYAYWPHVIWRTKVGERRIETRTVYHDNSVLPQSFNGKMRKDTSKIEPIIYTVTLYLYTSAEVALYSERCQTPTKTPRTVLQRSFGDKSL